MTRIFVSYSSKNRDLVNQLVQLLDDAGYEVWYDQQIRTGEWWKIILENVRASDIFLYAVTPEYLDSYPCDLEYRYALAVNRPMCAIRLSAIDFGRVPSHIAVAQVIDVSNLESNNQSLPTRLIRALTELQKHSNPLPNPLPPEPPAPIMKLNDVIEKVRDWTVRYSQDEQQALLNQIRPYLHQARSLDNARYTLQRMLNRNEPDAPRDLFGDVVEEIRSLLNWTASGTPTQPTPISTPIMPATKQQQQTTRKTQPQFSLLIGAAVIVALIIGGIVLSTSQNGVGTTVTATSSVASAVISSATTSAPKTAVALLLTTAPATIIIPPTSSPRPLVTPITQSNTLSVEDLANTADAQDALNAALALTQTATLWTKTATPTLTPSVTLTATPNLQASVDALRAQRVVDTQTQIAVNKSATAALWTKTPTATLTPTITNTYTVTTTPTLSAGSERTDSFGIKQVYVPAGCFMMGSDPSKDSNANKDEQPQHQVCISKAYWLDEFDVTNAAFDAFVEAGGYTNDSLWSADGLSWKQSDKITGPDTSCTQYSIQPNQPRVCVSYYEAEAYAKWRGSSLPTEAQWEYAARGPNGSIYPGGDSFDQSKANTTENKIGETTAVDAYPSGKSWVGAYDMAGNVWQWIADWYSDTYYGTSPTNDPTGPSSGPRRGLRGGSFSYSQNSARSAYRLNLYPYYRYSYVGFRGVGGVPGSDIGQITAQATTMGPAPTKGPIPIGGSIP
jgi:formylglycine-generating enzyme required for sulfatase activity